MNLRDLSDYVNKSYTYFSVMKKGQKDKYDLIFSFDENPFKSIDLFKIYIKELLEKAQYILEYYEFNKDELLSILHNISYSKNQNISNLYTQMVKLAYQIVEEDEPLALRYKQIEKLQLLEPVYERIYNE